MTQCSRYGLVLPLFSFVGYFLCPDILLPSVLFYWILYCKNKCGLEKKHEVQIFCVFKPLQMNCTRHTPAIIPMNISRNYFIIPVKQVTLVSNHNRIQCKTQAASDDIYARNHMQDIGQKCLKCAPTKINILHCFFCVNIMRSIFRGSVPLAKRQLGKEQDKLGSIKTMFSQMGSAQELT